ncbi:MAG: response regulator transcription factor [Pseudomonadota bacterium]
MQEHILIVDDDRQVTSFLGRFFQKNGYRTTAAASSRELFAALDHDDADLVVLDLILPDEDGLDAARRIQQTRDTPIIMLSARNEAHDRIVGLELGADDYVTKPYDPRELLARVRSVLRRHRHMPQDAQAEDHVTLFRFDGVEVDTVRAKATRLSDGADLGLTTTEFTLLRCLVEAGGELVGRDSILNAVYGDFVEITDRAIDAHMVRLRRKLAGATGDRGVISTVHGRGYRLASQLSSLS